MFFRDWTARRRKAWYERFSSSARSSTSDSSSASEAGTHWSNKPPAASSATVRTPSEGRRIVIETQFPVVAGGNTIWMRSPFGSDPERMGRSAEMLCFVALATSFPSRMHQSKSANGSAVRTHPLRRSTNASPGRLMQISVTSASSSKGRNARSVSSSDDTSTSLLAGAPSVGLIALLAGQGHRPTGNPDRAQRTLECARLGFSQPLAGC